MVFRANQPETFYIQQSEFITCNRSPQVTGCVCLPVCVSRLCEGGRLSPGSRHSLNNKSMSAESPEAHAHPAQLRSVHVCTALCHLCVSQSTPVRTRHRGRQIKHKHTQTDRHTKTGKYVSGDKNNVFAIKITSYAKSSLQASESELRLDTK